MKYPFYLYFSCCVAIFGGIMFGFDIAIIAGAIPFIQSYFSWNELQLGWGVSSLLVGCIIGSFGSGYVTNKYGRKRVLIVAAIIFGISCAGTGIATNETTFILNRLLGGISVGAISVLSPMYVAEMAPASMRGRMTAVYQLCIMLGILLSYMTNYFLKDLENNWRLMFISGVVPATVFFIGLLFIPESPRWLTIRGQKQKALAILQRFYSPAEAQNITADVEKNLAAHHTTKASALFNKDSRSSIVLGLILAVLVQLIGCNAALDYAPKIMMAAGFSISSALYFNIFMGVINLIATVIGVVLIDRVGRRPLYFYGSLIMGVSLFFLGFSFHHSLPVLVTLLFLFSYIACFSACIGPVFWTLVSEMFPNAIRSKAVALVSFTQWIFNFLVVWLFPFTLATFGGNNTFYFFAVMCLIQLAIAKFMLPETKGKSLEEIEQFWLQKQRHASPLADNASVKGSALR
ncbi:sugar porter family MFS transporter [Atlantibacter sp.]|uniref:sugar porter family MFS transporter n=1 Tax=Atlantibacter sp. TaxID=1903473 RepID=UPI0028A900D6|nr:sugar porter family MFS transporter [Atlantibacter sp.]